MNPKQKNIRRLMLATEKMDGAYYFYSRKKGAKENVMALLYALDDGEPHSQQQICRDWLIPKTTVNTNVKELVKAGYAALQEENGKREKAIVLTEKGKAYAARILRQIYKAEQTALSRTLEKFSPEFIDAMDYFCGCLCQELEQAAVQD